MRKPKLKKGAWFYKVRGSYLPVTWQAWLLYIPYVGFLVSALAMSVRTQNSLTRILFMTFPQWVAAAVVMTWIATRKS